MLAGRVPHQRSLTSAPIRPGCYHAATTQVKTATDAWGRSSSRRQRAKSGKQLGDLQTEITSLGRQQPRSMPVAFSGAALDTFVAAAPITSAALASINCCNPHSARWRIRSPSWSTSIAARSSDKADSDRPSVCSPSWVLGGTHQEITPMAHLTVDPRNPTTPRDSYPRGSVDVALAESAHASGSSRSHGRIGSLERGIVRCQWPPETAHWRPAHPSPQ